MKMADVKVGASYTLPCTPQKVTAVEKAVRRAWRKDGVIVSDGTSEFTVFQRNLIPWDEYERGQAENAQDEG